MEGIVTFSYATWALRYAELAATVEEPLAQLYFNEACLYCDNTATSPIQDATVSGQRELILNMATAHIAALNAPIGGMPSPQVVGRITSATQGSVSVQLQNDHPPGSVQWWQQTKYGAAFWMATARYRAFRYVSKQRRNMDTFSPLGDNKYNG
jgi:hypothetical protein